ncbi:4-hydroxy-tetrahydrodipicolinate synthase [Neisseria sp. Ec49-e6-T10]|uniref:4-hydroxy-tetrahydrodipicolinate synthase n=1 Tax=Neisseria sp. Ec49-e6-T10 TaxID=3140744 RepID=UPI003EBA0A22
MLKGSIVAIITPMLEDGQVDYPSLNKLIDWHIQSGTDAIVSVGTTGESATLNVEEHLNVISATVKHVNKRIPVIAGTGGNSTAEAIALASEAQRLGADMSLSVVPYYNKPTQEGIYQHFKAIAEKTSLPIILYNVPGRTVADMSNETALRLAQIDNIVGIKDATGNLARACDLFLRAPENFAIYTGEDGVAMAFLLSGGHGVISVTANVAPELMKQMCDAALKGDIQQAKALNNKLQGLHSSLFCEANPIPAKWAVAHMGLCKDTLRLPMTPLSESGQTQVLAAMKQAQLI